jgi:hypothetical protein
MKPGCNIDIGKLISDREAFNKFVYTPVDEAIKELKRRQGDKELEKKILKSLDNNLPQPLRDGPRAVFFGHATPNYEIRRFVSIIDLLGGLKVLFMEYLDDKFVPENDRKISLGRLKFFHGKGKKGGDKIDCLKIIDFNSCNGKKISEVKTLWGEPIMEFHHRLFMDIYRPLKSAFYDISPWLRKHGEIPGKYYESVLRLCIKHSIIFENFMLDIKEASFTKDVFLPAFIKVYKETGCKPLIVALEPTEIEGDEFWMCYPPDCEKYTERKVLSSGKKLADRKLHGFFNKVFGKINGLAKI